MSPSAQAWHGTSGTPTTARHGRDPSACHATDQPQARRVTRADNRRHPRLILAARKALTSKVSGPSASLGDDMRTRADSPTKTCTFAGCERPLRARGLCSTHYNQAHQPDRHAKVTVPCDWCAVLCKKSPTSRWSARYCSQACYTSWHKEEARKRHALPVLWVKPKRMIMQPVVSETARAWVSGACRHCGSRFIDRQLTARFCSPRCYHNWHRQRRKERAGSIVSAATRALVYVRDAGVCQLCLTVVDMDLPPTHAWGPTVDHIICQSWTLLPDHRATNLRLAHRWCNSKRADERYAA